jgi:hypothetical protein
LSTDDARAIALTTADRRGSHTPQQRGTLIALRRGRGSVPKGDPKGDFDFMTRADQPAPSAPTAVTGQPQTFNDLARRRADLEAGGVPV